jgi:hypothetical protein
VDGFGAGVGGVAGALPLEAGVVAGAGLLGGTVEAAGAAGGVAEGVAADSAVVDFFERLFLGAAALLSAGAVVLAAESPAAVAFFDFVLGLADSEVDGEAEEAEASVLSAEADFFERLFLGAAEVELSAVVAFSSAAVDFVDLVFFFEDAVPASAGACEDEASAEALSAVFFFLVFFLVESVWL